MGKSKIELQPIVFSKHYADAVEQLVVEYFKQFIFQPLMNQLRPPSMISNITKLKNSKPTDRDVLIDMIMKGVIYFHRGVFKGKFSAETTREMRRLKATFNSKDGSWHVPAEKIPYPIQTAIMNSQTTFDQVVQRIQKKLNSVTSAEFAGSIPLEKIFEKIIYKVDDQVQASLLGIPGTKKVNGEIVLDDSLKPNQKRPILSKGQTLKPDGAPIISPTIEQVKAKQNLLGQITVSPKFTPEQVTKIAEDYSDNMKLSIKGWTDEKVKELRTMVEQKVLEGVRYEGIAKIIQESYGQSQNKAQFLARQETNLLTTKIKETRYEKAGVVEYKWKCVAGSAAHPVRPLHKVHDNKVFRFDNPPIVDKKGNRKNPGEDYNCRCVAIPIVRFDD